MSDEFVPLAMYLRPAAALPVVEASPVCDNETSDLPRVLTESDDAIRAARLFRAALADALDIAVQSLVRTIARDVLARELELDRADVAGIVTNALDRQAGERVLSIRAHPMDLAALASIGLERIADDTLAPGDILMVLHSGTIDLSLNARLESAIGAVIP
jgi:flagellar biosynthesis/type III secretory pathway protein FliH